MTRMTDTLSTERPPACSMKKPRSDVGIGCRIFAVSRCRARISTEKYPRVCFSGCKLVSESHCEAPGIYNYRAGVLFQQDCEVNKPAGEKRREKESVRKRDGREEARGNEEKSSARTFSRYSACWKVDGTRRGGEGEEETRRS